MRPPFSTIRLELFEMFIVPEKEPPLAITIVRLFPPTFTGSDGVQFVVTINTHFLSLPLNENL